MRGRLFVASPRLKTLGNQPAVRPAAQPPGVVRRSDDGAKSHVAVGHEGVAVAPQWSTPCSVTARK